jgi:hypothetical protein
MRRESRRNDILTLECARCGRYLRPEAFNRNDRMRHGCSSWCHECTVESTRQWRTTNADAINAARRAAYAAAKGGPVRRYWRGSTPDPLPGSQ